VRGQPSLSLTGVYRGGALRGKEADVIRSPAREEPGLQNRRESRRGRRGDKRADRSIDADGSEPPAIRPEQLLAEAERWKACVGQRAVYPGYGVALIEEFGQREIGGQVCEFLVLRMTSGACIWIPIAKLAEVGLRPLVKAEEAEKIWEILRTKRRGRGARGQTWIRQFREFQDRIKTESIFGVAEVVRDLMLLQRDKELSFGEHKVLDSARTLVAEELAAVQERAVPEVLAEIKALLR